MEIYGSYKKYREHLPEYKNWSSMQDLQNAKRLAYLKQNPDKINKDDIERGKALMSAIDVMDEYSQSNAEDMEVVTEMMANQVVGLTSSAGMFLGTACMFLPRVQRIIKNVTNPFHAMLISFTPSIVGLFLGLLTSIPVIAQSAKLQVGASRKGRFEAMRNDLSNPAAFAVLDEKQKAEARELAKGIELEDKEKERIKKIRGMNLNPLESFRVLKKAFKDDEYKAQKADFDKVLKENESHFNEELSEDKIRAANRDKQILANLVRKIDIASQDYAENAELATNTLTTLAFASGGLVGWASNKLLKLFKASQGSKLAKFIPWAVGLALPLTASVYATKLQKQASRIGRFNIKQEILNTPESMVYVDDKDANSMQNVKLPEKKKKPNIFKFMFQLFKDNKKYQEYIKTKRVEDLKFQKAVEKIQISDEQLQQAKVLQMNTFKTFNKVDEKSQTYSESVEAAGEMAKQVLMFVLMPVAMICTGMASMRLAKSNLNKPEAVKKYLIGSLLPLAAAILPVVGLDIYITKEQKKASRVADMLALKELDNYKNYADYSSVKTKEKTETVAASSNLLSKFAK